MFGRSVNKKRVELGENMTALAEFLTCVSISISQFSVYSGSQLGRHVMAPQRFCTESIRRTYQYVSAGGRRR